MGPVGARPIGPRGSQQNFEQITNISRRAIVNYSREYNKVERQARQIDDPKLFKKLLKEQIAKSNETSQ